ASPATRRRARRRGRGGRSRDLDGVDDADDHRADRHDVALAEDLPGAVALGEDEDPVARPGLGAVDGEEARAEVGAALVDRLDDEEGLAPVGGVVRRGDDVAEDAGQAHHPSRAGVSTASTTPTIAASTGTNQGSQARAASREP